MFLFYLYEGEAEKYNCSLLLLQEILRPSDQKRLSLPSIRKCSRQTTCKARKIRGKKDVVRNGLWNVNKCLLTKCENMFRIGSLLRFRRYWILDGKINGWPTKFFIQMTALSWTGLLLLPNKFSLTQGRLQKSKAWRAGGKKTSYWKCNPNATGKIFKKTILKYKTGATLQ